MTDLRLMKILFLPLLVSLQATHTLPHFQRKAIR